MVPVSQKWEVGYDFVACVSHFAAGKGSKLVIARAKLMLIYKCKNGGIFVASEGDKSAFVSHQELGRLI